jgi:hypothetical protein
MALDIMALGIMALDIMALGIMALGIMALSITFVSHNLIPYSINVNASDNNNNCTYLGSLGKIISFVITLLKEPSKEYLMKHVTLFCFYYLPMVSTN